MRGKYTANALARTEIMYTYILGMRNSILVHNLVYLHKINYLLFFTYNSFCFILFFIPIME